MTTPLSSRIPAIGVFLWNADTESFDLTGDMALISITEQAAPSVSHAALRAVLGYRPDVESDLPPEMATLFATTAELRRIDDGSRLMRCVILGPHVVLDGQGGDSVTYTAKEFESWRLSNLYLYSHRALAYDGSAQPFTGLSPVFNPADPEAGGKRLYNASAAPMPFEISGVEDARCFAPWTDSTSIAWTYAEALLAIIGRTRMHEELTSPVRHAPELVWPTRAELEAITQLTAEVDNVACDGLSVWELLTRLVTQARCRMAVRYEDVAGLLTPHLHIWPIGGGTSKTVLLQAAGETLDPDLSQVDRAEWHVDYSAIVNRPLVVGGRAEVEGTWPLVPGWGGSSLNAELEPPPPPIDPDDPEEMADYLSDTYISRYTSRGSAYHLYRDAGRLWLLNECGQATHPFYLSQPEFDLAAAVPGYQWARLPRPFHPPLTADHDGRRLPVLVELRIVEGATEGDWQAIEGCELLGQMAGVRLAHDDLAELMLIGADGNAISYWDALGDAALTIQMRITATLISDDRMGYHDGSSGSLPEYAYGWYDRRTLYRRQELLWTGDYQSRYNAHGYPHTVRYDSTALLAEAASIRNLTASPRLSGSIRLVGVEHDYQLGDSIEKIAGREISLTVGGGTSGTQRRAEVVRINRMYAAAGGAITELTLDDPLAATITGGA